MLREFVFFNTKICFTSMANCLLTTENSSVLQRLIVVVLKQME